MPRIKTILCGGIGILYITALTAQSVPKNKTLTNVVGYQVHLQKQWSYNQLPKNSIQYRSDPKYIPFEGLKISTTKLNLHPIANPDIKKSSSKSLSFFQIPLNTSLQRTSYSIPTLSWDPHMGDYVFVPKLSQFEKFQKFKNKSLVAEKLFLK
jgi:hypothetical protein